MTVLEYVAKVIELAHFGDDYVATNMAKVGKFKDGLKLSIRGKIVGFLLQDIDSMVRTTMAIKREIEDARSIRDLSASGKKEDFYPTRISGTRSQLSGLRLDQGFQSVRIDDMFPLPSARTCEKRLPVEAGIPRIRNTAVPVISGTGADTVCFFSPQCRPERLVSVSGCDTGAFCYTNRPERSGYGSRSRIKLTGRDFRDLGACLCHHTPD